MNTRQFFLFCCMFLGISLTIMARKPDYYDWSDDFEKKNELEAIFGYSKIGDQSYMGFRFQPHLHFWKIGIGLDVPVMLNLNDASFKMDEYQDGIGALRMLRYLSWGSKKYDPLYFKVGNIRDASLGYGLLVHNYQNSISYDKRKVGLELDYCYKRFIGMEVLYSDLNFKSLNLLGLRPYVRPLSFTHIPILETMDVGFNFVTDLDNTGPIAATDLYSNTSTFLNRQGSMTGLGLDLGITFIDMEMVHLAAFMGGATLLENQNPAFIQYVQDSIASQPNGSFANNARTYSSGYGASIGLDFKIRFLGNMLRTDLRMERLMYSDHFIPHFFDYTYELNKDARILSLIDAKQKKGIYGSLGIQVLEKAYVKGALMLPDNLDSTNPALLRLEADASDLLENTVLTAYYIKGALGTLSDALTLDDRSFLTVRAAYEIIPFVIAGVDYRWNWSVQQDGSFKASSYWTPYVGFRYRFTSL